MPITDKSQATIEVRFIDTDPDSGKINQDECVCLVQHPDDGLWIIGALKADNPFENRDFCVYDTLTGDILK
jgi:hypothetical protein